MWPFLCLLFSFSVSLYVFFCICVPVSLSLYQIGKNLVHSNNLIANRTNGWGLFPHFVTFTFLKASLKIFSAKKSQKDQDVTIIKPSITPSLRIFFRLLAYRWIWMLHYWSTTHQTVICQRNLCLCCLSIASTQLRWATGLTTRVAEQGLGCLTHTASMAS